MSQLITKGLLSSKLITQGYFGKIGFERMFISFSITKPMISFTTIKPKIGFTVIHPKITFKIDP